MTSSFSNPISRTGPTYSVRYMLSDPGIMKKEWKKTSKVGKY